jgi:hypothetical protein
MPLPAKPAEDSLSIQPDKTGDFLARQAFLNPAQFITPYLKTGLKTKKGIGKRFFPMPVPID